MTVLARQKQTAAPVSTKVKSEERFLSTQADMFAGANVKGKDVGLLRSK
jgi:hypothetical protein